MHNVTDRQTDGQTDRQTDDSIMHTATIRATNQVP